MFSSNQIEKIIMDQDKVYNIRKVARNVALRYISNSNIPNKLNNGESLSSDEINYLLKICEIHHPIPSDKINMVKNALYQEFNFRSFNEFGQELKDEGEI